MAITIVSTLMIMLGYFLMLYGAVGFIQDKRLFSSAHKEYLAVIPDKKERFKGAHIIGWIILIVAICLFVGAFAIAIWDGARNQFGALKFFARFITMLYAMEIYDILFFDWYLLCRSNFFIHFYPELKSVDRSHFFGYNKKSHITHFIIYIPVCAAIALGLGVLF
ncbi:MAG: hypothetical protein LUH56_06995 [Oscillospiraceae bacterium]|nr:hypothetical protein [Oscillospiraceae bacterium]